MSPFVPFSSHSNVFDGFSIMFTIVFCLVIGVFVVTFFKGISTWNKNNRSPQLTVSARVVTKRTSMRRSSGSEMRGWTNYFVTFEVESGDRMELEMRGEQYGLLVEGDVGKLTFQGTRYISFERR